MHLQGFPCFLMMLATSSLRLGTSTPPKMYWLGMSLTTLFNLIQGWTLDLPYIRTCTRSSKPYGTNVPSSNHFLILVQGTTSQG